MTVRYYSSTAGEMLLQASITSSDTSVIVDTVAGLPTSYPYTLILDYGTASEEIVDVTNAVGTTLTITRGQDSTVPQAHTAGAAIRHGVTGRDHRDSREHEEATAAHGVTEVVGTTDAQTLDEKTFEPQADHAALTVRQASGNTEPVVDWRDSSDTRWGGIYDRELRGVTSGSTLWGLMSGGTASLFKKVVDLYLRSDIHAITGTKVTGATGKFLRLLATDGTTETFSVDADGNVAVQDLAAAGDATVAGALDVTGDVTGSDGTFDGTEWTDVTVSGGFASIGPSEKPQVRRIGKVVYMQGGWAATGLSASGTFDVGTVPVGFRPTQNQIIQAGSSSGAVVAQGFVSSTGVIQIRTGSTLGPYYKFTLSWLID